MRVVQSSKTKQGEVRRTCASCGAVLDIEEGDWIIPAFVVDGVRENAFCTCPECRGDIFRDEITAGQKAILDKAREV